MGKTDFTAKRLYRIAQASALGKCLMNRALKGHQKLGQPIESTREALVLHFGCHSRGASFSSSSSNPATRSDGVLECWSTAPIWNCTPRPRGWECFQGALPGIKPRAEAWAILYNRFAVKPAFLFALSPFRPFAASPIRSIGRRPGCAILPLPWKTDMELIVANFWRIR